MSDSMHVPYKPLEGFSGALGYAHDGDAGFDLRASHDAVIEPLSRVTVRCGFALAIPEGYGGLVIPRSGLASRHGITVLNAPGLVDSGYRGEIMVVLHNTDAAEPFHVTTGDRIAQMSIVAMPQVSLVESDALDETHRGSGGFGSSGTR